MTSHETSAVADAESGHTLRHEPARRSASGASTSSASCSRPRPSPSCSRRRIRGSARFPGRSWSSARSRSTCEARASTANRSRRMPGWPFNGVLYVLFALQLANVALLVRMVALYGFFTTDTLVGWLMVGINSGYSGLVVAHELIHRASSGMQQLGRLMLVSVLYEHFYTEHVRGHHARVGTARRSRDRALRRGCHGLLRAHRARRSSGARGGIEAKRLGDVDMPWWDPRLLRSRVVHGLVLEWGVAAAILVDARARRLRDLRAPGAARDSAPRSGQLLRALGARARRRAACARSTRGTPTRGSRSTRWSASRATPTIMRTPRDRTSSSATSRRARSCRTVTSARRS